jgi:hypothetical protein
LEYLREVVHLRPRTNVIGAATRVRHSLAAAIHRFFDENGFFWVNTPIITGSDAEGAGALFRVSTLDLANLPRTPDGKVDFAQDFFGREAFLTVSGQLNIEAYCLALTKVYTFGPTFRAENSNTSRHLAAFWMIEPVIVFCGPLKIPRHCWKARYNAPFSDFLLPGSSRENITRTYILSLRPIVLPLRSSLMLEIAVDLLTRALFRCSRNRNRGISTG